jgi:hypothetical protein
LIRDELLDELAFVFARAAVDQYLADQFRQSELLSASPSEEVA